MRSLVWVYAGPICHTAVFYLNGQCEDWSGFTLVPCINFVNKKRYDKICHIWGVTSENWECYAEINCLWEHKEDMNRRVTIMEGLQNIMQ